MSEGLTRTGRYIARLNAELQKKASDADRLAFLQKEMVRWETEYLEFQNSNGQSHQKGDGLDQPKAFDFVETITAIQQAIDRYTEKQDAA